MDETQLDECCGDIRVVRAELGSAEFQRLMAEQGLSLEDAEQRKCEGGVLGRPGGEAASPGITAVVDPDGRVAGRAPQGGLNLRLLRDRASAALDRRATELGLDLSMGGLGDKAASFDDFLERHHTEATRVAFIGDDLPDLVVGALRAHNHGVLVCKAFDRLEEIARMLGG